MKSTDYIDLSVGNQPFEGLIPAFAQNMGEEYMTGKLEGASDYLEIINDAKVMEYIADNVETPKHEGQFASFEGFVSKVAIEGNDEPETWPVNTILTLIDGTKVEIEGERLTYKMVGFKYGSEMKSAIVGSRVKSLENGGDLEGVFSSSDSKLESVQLPDTLEYIGDCAFYGCMWLKELIIPDSVNHIGTHIVTNLLISQLFANDINIKLPNNPELVIYNNAFQQLLPTSVFTIDVPSTVKIVNNSAFTGVYNVNYSGDLNTSKWGAKHYNCYADGYLLFTDGTKANLIELSPNTNGTLIIPNTVTNDISELFINFCDNGDKRKQIKNLILGESIIVSDSTAFTGILNVEYHGGDTNAPWGAKFLNAYIESNVVYLDNTKATLLGSTGGYIIIPESVTKINFNATITEGATISKLYSTYTKPSLFNESQTVRFDKVDSNTFTGDYNVSVLFAKGTSKTSKTYTIYTNDQTIYNQMKSFGANTNNYVIVNLYHLNGSAWE